MNIRLWLTGAAGAAAIAAALAFAPITPTSAQEIAPADSAAVVMNGHGQGQGTMAHDGTCDEANFVDADGDGVCDNMGSEASTNQHANANAGQQANASDNYVDADGDGACDNTGTGAGTGSQSRRGRP